MPKFGDVYKWQLGGQIVMVINDDPIAFIVVSKEPEPYYLVSPTEGNSDSSVPWTDGSWEFVTAGSELA